MRLKRPMRQDRGTGSVRLLRLPLALLVILTLMLGGGLMSVAPAHAAYTGPTWSQLSPATSPPGREGASMALDPVTGQLLLFGGFNGRDLNDTWSWNGTTWSQLSPATSPPAREYASMAYDPATGHILLFGGSNISSTSNYLNDTWSWNGTTWSQLSPATSPPARAYASMALDPATGHILLFGGSNISSGGGYGSYLNDTWSWNGTTWSQLSPATSPPARAYASMALDPATGHILLFSGYSDSGTLGDTWSWNGTTWSQLSPATSPPGRLGASMALDPATGQTLLFGGFEGSDLNDTWSWNGQTWSQLSPVTSPPARDFATMAYDTATNQTLLFGGFNGSSGFLNDTWTYGPGPTDATPPTTTISLSPTTPSGLNGWYTGPVTVSVSATDTDDASSTLTTRCVLDLTSVPASYSYLPSGSCAYAASGGAPVSSDGTHTLYAASEDPAGNVETGVQRSTFKIDQTKPGISATLSPASPAGSGWYNVATGAPTVSFPCSDATSGIASSCPASYTFPDGANQSNSASVSDNAGNSNSAGVSGINVDLTPPTVTCQPASFVYGQSGAQVSAAVSDVTSGPVQPSVSASASTSSVGNFSASLTATDNAGNSTTQNCPYSVGQAGQSITFNPLPSVTYGVAPFTVSATGGGSTSPVTFTATGNCSASGTNGATITVTGAGSCTVTASQLGDRNYTAATSVSQTFTIAKASATITLDNGSLSATYDGSAHLATATTTPSGLSYSVSYTDAAGNAVTSPTNAGSYGVAALVTDPNYQGNTAGTLIIAKANQTLTFGYLAGHRYGDQPFTISATASSGLPVSYAVGSADACTISGTTLTITGGGSCTVTASQVGDGNFNAAPSISRTFSIARAATTTALTSSPNPSVVGLGVTFTATVVPAGGSVTQSGSITFKDGSTTLGTQTLSGGTATFTTNRLAQGGHTITAIYSGDSNYQGGTSAALVQNVDTNLAGYPKQSNGASNLTSLNLSGAYLVGANLAGANLASANVSNANLSGASLTGANLSSANFSGANFSGADLTNANLSNANLKGATGLSTANLTGVIWSKTTCPDNTLSSKHSDHDTCVGHL